MKNKKAKRLPKEVWTEVASRNVKWESIQLSNLLEWIVKHVPTGTPNENIRLEFEVTEEPTYYDDTIVDVEMNLKVKL